MKRFAILASCAAIQSAVAFCPQPVVKVCSAYFESDSVFIGREVEHTDIYNPDDEGGGIDGYRHRFKVERRFKGKPAAFETLASENGSGRWLEEGPRAIVFARGGRIGGQCSPIEKLENAAETLAQIEALKAARDSTIEGIVSDAATGAGANRAIEVIGKRRRYSTVTDASGAFVLRVPPGRYRFATPGLEPFEPYSRTDLQGIDLKRGQCAQLMLQVAGS